MKTAMSYKHPDKVRPDIDGVIEAAMSMLGWERYATGYNAKTQQRDLCFVEKGQKAALSLQPQDVEEVLRGNLLKAIADSGNVLLANAEREPYLEAEWKRFEEALRLAGCLYPHTKPFSEMPPSATEQQIEKGE